MEVRLFFENSLFNLLHKACKWHVSMPFSFWAIAFFQRDVTTQLMQMFPVVNLSYFFHHPWWTYLSVTIQICLGNESSTTAGQKPPYRSYDVTIGHENVYVNNSGQNGVRGVRGVCEVSLCLSYAASCDMQHEIPGHSSGQIIWSDLKSIFFKLTFRGQNARV